MKIPSPQHTITALIDATMTARELAISAIGDRPFARLVKSSGEAEAIKAAWHRMLAEQHQERARWQRARST